MDDAAAVSCLLCLQADEWGSMIKVCVAPGGFAPRPPVVICRACAAEVSNELHRTYDEELGPGPEATPESGDLFHGGSSASGPVTDSRVAESAECEPDPPER